MAVGEFNPEGGFKTEYWDGEAWVLETSQQPGEIDGGTLRGVACILGAPTCIATGSYIATKKGLRITLAQVHRFVKAPTVATEGASNPEGSQVVLHGTVNPNGQDTVYRFEYDTSEYKLGEGSHGVSVPAPSEDIGSGESNVSVSQSVTGLKHHTTYHYRIVAENSQGVSYGNDATVRTGEWATQSTPNPELRTEDSLEAVSCPSASVCLAVGDNIYSGDGFIETWNGSEWKLLTTLPNSELKGVSCPSATWCAVIGKGGGAWKLVWNESKAKWTLESIAQPTVPTGATEFTLNGVSCTAQSACTAVGSYNLESSYKTLAERWNGTSWSQQSTPQPSEGSASNAMLRVSCGSSVSCITVGKAAGKPFAERWNGSEWATMTIPNPSGSIDAALESVSCISESSCIAAGSFSETGKTGSYRPLVERWKGGEWKVVTAPSPSGAKGDVKLRGVSCLSSSSCYAVGNYASKASSKGVSEEEKTLAESWNGSEWTVQSSPNPEGKLFSLLGAVSCYSSSACTAVGSARPGSGAENTVTLAERYE
jgi:hypothetical protein